MQRVYLIRALRFAVSGSVFSSIVSLLALWGIGREVWVAQVLQNAPQNFFEIPRFYFAAFLHTHFIVQVLIILFALSAIYLVREIVHAVEVVQAGGTWH